MSTDFVILRETKGGRILKAARDGASLTLGFAPHDETKVFPAELGAIAAFQDFVKKARRKGFVSNEEHHAQAAAAEEVPFEPDRRRLLRDGETFGGASLEVRDVGWVEIRSGKLAGRDPFLDAPAIAFARSVPNGRHRVALSLVTLPAPRGKQQVRCAAATIHFAKGAVASLVAAPFEAPTKTKRGLAAYGVDAGTGAFMDVRTASEVDDSTRARIIKETTKARRSGFGFASLDTPSLVAFTSGWGDGAYASYWGFSRAKKLSAS
jgi:hypothetical protein